MKINRTSVLMFFLALIFNTFIFFKLISIYFGNNPLNNSQTGLVNYVSVFPEGWAFFTKSSKDPRLYIFNCNENRIENINLRNFSKDYYFGISRHNRILNVELGNIISNIHLHPIKSFSIRADNENNIPSKLKISEIKFSNLTVSKKQNYHFKGKYLIVVQYLLPWSLLNRKPDYPSKYVIYPINIIQK